MPNATGLLSYPGGVEREERSIQLVIVFTLVGLVAALATGGSTDRLASTRFRHPWLVFVGLVLQVGVQTFTSALPDQRTALALLLASMGLIALFLLLNLKIPGMALAAAGLVLNVVVIGANGAMPVHPPSAEAAGVPISSQEGGVKHEVMGDATVLPWLGDAIALPLFKTVISLGDVLLALGVALFVYRATRGAAGRRSVTGASGSAPATKP